MLRLCRTVCNSFFSSSHLPLLMFFFKNISNINDISTNSVHFPLRITVSNGKKSNQLYLYRRRLSKWFTWLKSIYKSVSKENIPSEIGLIVISSDFFFGWMLEFFYFENRFESIMKSFIILQAFESIMKTPSWTIQLFPKTHSDYR